MGEAAQRATLTATVDQLQAELDAINRQVLALSLALLGLAVCIAIISWRTRNVG